MASPTEPDPDEPARVDAEAGRSWARWTTAGFEFGAAVLLFFLLGQYLDARWGSAPWVTVAGTFTGVAAGTYMLVRQALRDERGRREPPRSESR